MDNINSQLESGFRTAFIDSSETSGEQYRPKFISNDFRKGKKVLSSIEEGLNNCEYFRISVAFITDSGIAPLLQTLKELEMKGVQGKILTTDYLTFSSPKALEKLSKLSNVELRMFRVHEGPGFHTKGYIFTKGELYNIIVGSSNLTASALTTNAEWNTKIVSTADGEFARETLIEFDYYWDHAEPIEELLDTYTKIFNEQQRIAKENASNSPIIDFEQATLKPNDMQVEFTNELGKIINMGEDRALLISATGTGKTYASAFGLRDADGKPFKKILFMVHREQIARQACKSYKKVFGSNVSVGFISGNTKDYDADIIFATVQTISKDYVLEKFSKDHFDAIVVDEVHRAGAELHQKVMKYFKPKLFLGMTASPERTDGYDIFELFNHNIACEIRLQEALEGNYLCPFHYFGISDLEINGETIDDKADFNRLVLDSRVDHIINKIEYYGYSGDRVKGLVFCSRKEEAKTLSEKFNDRGYSTVFLSGEDSQDKREDAIKRLTSDDIEDKIDYIFTVDIFNEGVDIPEINQVVILRPTQSPIIFVQQLGRGLRKYEDKEYVVIIDFIGNYENNFMIPIALSGDKSYNPDNIRKYVREGTRVIPGASTVHFDRVSKQRIYNMIDSMKPRKQYKTSYYYLKNKLGRIPTVLDFYDYGEIDPLLFIKDYKTFDQFVRKIDTEYTVQFSDEEELYLTYISTAMLNVKRPHEIILLQMLIDGEKINSHSFRQRLETISESYTDISYESAMRAICKKFLTEGELSKYSSITFVNNKGGEYFASEQFAHALLNDDFKNEILNLTKFGLRKYTDTYKNHDKYGFSLYEKYSRTDVCRILNWDKDEYSTMYGYKVKHGTCPIFVTYEKKEDISDSTKYPDHFTDENTFVWATRNKRTLESDEVQKIVNSERDGLLVPLFIKKSDDEGSLFYYMGMVKPIAWEETTINHEGKNLPIVHFTFRLENEVRSDVYDYITEELVKEGA